MTTALLLDVLNKTLRKEIEPMVVRAVLRERMSIVQILDDNYDRKRKRDDAKLMSSPLDGFLTMYATKQSNSVVEYPAGYHVDVFGDKPSLENKKCFILRHKSEYVGRGGAGPGKYVFALLDWTGTVSATRRNEYLAATRQLPDQVPRVTAEMFQSHFGMTFEEYQEAQAVYPSDDEDTAFPSQQRRDGNFVNYGI